MGTEWGWEWSIWSEENDKKKWNEVFPIKKFVHHDHSAAAVYIISQVVSFKLKLSFGRMYDSFRKHMYTRLFGHSPKGQCPYRSVNLGRIISVSCPFHMPCGCCRGGHGTWMELEPEIRGRLRGNDGFCQAFLPGYTHEWLLWSLFWQMHILWCASSACSCSQLCVHA